MNPYYNCITIIKTGGDKLDKTLNVRINDMVIADLDLLVKNGIFSSKSDAIRDFTRRGIREELKKLKVEKVKRVC